MMETSNKHFRVRKGPSGVHLFNRDSGLNVLFDEVDVPEKNWSKAPRQVSIALTNICDLECNHCYAPKDSKSIPLNSVLEWLDELDKNDCLGVGFGGGEPALYDNLLEACRFGKNETNLAITITTHGHHFDEQFTKELSESLHFIRVSMGGVGETYETIQNRSFKNLLEKINTIATYTSFGINYLVNRKTFNDLNEAIKIAENLGAEQFLLLPEEPVGRGAEIDSKTNDKLINWVNNYTGQVPLAISKSQSDGFPICDPTSVEDNLYEYAHVDAAGVLKSTSFESHGVEINGMGIMKALAVLRKNNIN